MTSSFMYQTIFLATPSKSAFPGGLPVSHSDLHWTGQRSRAISPSPRPRRDKSSRFARMSRHRAGAGIRESGPGHAQSCIAHSEPQCKGDGEREKRDCCEKSLGDNMTSCVKLKL